MRTLNLKQANRSQEETKSIMARCVNSISNSSVWYEARNLYRDGLKSLLSYKSNEPEKYYFVSSDNAFTRKARILQAIRRQQAKSECGSISSKGITYYYPNLAKDGEINGCNFLSHEIFKEVKQRVDDKKNYETIQENRLFNNFLSSQPMAFNLFVPLKHLIKEKSNAIKLAGIINQFLLLPEFQKLAIISDIGIEFIPSYYKDCINDKTAMDAYFRYKTMDGRKGIIAIEVKYTDCLGSNEAKRPEYAINAATQRSGIFELFTQDGRDKIANREIKLSQIYRNFLLTECVRLCESLDDSISIILAPKENKSNEHDKYKIKEILTSNAKYKFQEVALEDFVNALITAFPNEDVFRDFKYRYLDFEIAEWAIDRLIQGPIGGIKLAHI